MADSGARRVHEYPVEVSVATDPVGRVRVLLQMPDGFVLMDPDSARLVAIHLKEAADEVDGIETVEVDWV